MGFGPQLVDLDLDGRKDLLSGTWVHRVIFFQRLEDGSFAAGRPLTHPDGKEIQIDYGTVVFATDWDADEDLDLIVGTAAGHIHLVPNQGSRTQPVWGIPQKLNADGKEIEIPGGDAGPATADWDGDGKLDLLSGTSDGSVVLFRNVGTSDKPQLAASQTLVPAPQAGSKRGLRSKICITDWNEDGKLDLIIGDCGDQFQKAFSQEEHAWLVMSKDRQNDLLTQWGSTFTEYRRLLKVDALKDDAPKDREEKLTALRNEMQRLNKLREKQGGEEKSLREQSQYHGRVWVALRSSGR